MCPNARVIESRKSESAECFLGLHCTSNLLLKNHANKRNLSFVSQICRLVTFSAGGGVGLQWPSDVVQGGRVPPCAVVAVGEHASVLANAQLNRERQGAWSSDVWPGTGRCSSLTRGDVKCFVGYRCAFISPSTACIKRRINNTVPLITSFCASHQSVC